MPRRPSLVNTVHFGSEEMWLKATTARDPREHRIFLAIGSELEQVYYTLKRVYRKGEYERVPRPANADEILASQRSLPPVELPHFQCEHRYDSGERCQARPEPTKRRNPRFCWEHQPEGKITVCDLHGWSTVLPRCPDCRTEKAHLCRGGVKWVVPDRTDPFKPKRRRSR